MSIFDIVLECFIDMNHELVLLPKQIDWEAVELKFAELLHGQRPPECPDPDNGRDDAVEELLQLE